MGVGPERGGQLGLEGLELFVQGQDVGRKLDDQSSSDVLAGKRTCWVRAASLARAATSAEERTPRARSHRVRRV